MFVVESLGIFFTTLNNWWRKCDFRGYTVELASICRIPRKRGRGNGKKWRILILYVLQLTRPPSTLRVFYLAFTYPMKLKMKKKAFRAKKILLSSRNILETFILVSVDLRGCDGERKIIWRVFLITLARFIANTWLFARCWTDGATWRWNIKMEISR